MRLSNGCFLALAGVFALAAPAAAHALLRHSDPAGGAVLQAPPEAVTITFTEQPEPALSTINVVDGAGRPVTRGPAQMVPGQPLELRAALPPLPTGLYTVTWRTVSRVDGHVTGGAFAFGVGVTPTSAAQAVTTSPPPSVAAVAGKWGLYVGLSGLLGAAWIWGFGLREPAGAAIRYLWILWCVAGLGVATTAAAQAADAGVSLFRLLGTSLGAAMWARAVPVAAAGGAILAMGWAPPGRRRIALAALGLGAAAGMLAQVLAGHAAANPGRWRLWNVADQWVHFVCVGVWIGGLAALLLSLHGAPDYAKAHAARRFSTVALFAVGILALTGVLRAVDEVGTWAALWSTDFGRVATIKAGLLVVLVVLGAVNRFRSVRAALTSLRPLRRVGGAELAVAATVLAATGVLTGLAPASLIPIAPGPSLVISGSDFGTSVRLRIEVVPGFPGLNRFVARLGDYDTGRPIVADRVTLRFTKSDRPDLGQSTVLLTRHSDGLYEGQGLNLSLDGQWTVTTVIERGTKSVEVPLTVTTRSRPQQVRTIAAPGQPTLYIADLDGGNTLNLYLDPGRPGFNEVHATFLTPSGGELPIPQPATIAAARSGTPPAALPVRRFGPGHFIADAKMSVGDWQLDIAATTSDGTILRGHLTAHL